MNFLDHDGRDSSARLGRTVRGLALWLLAGCVPLCAHADYPSRAVRLVVTAAPGGAADLLARLLGEHLSRSWGRPVVVDNRPGGNGLVAAEYVARSVADGHTLLVAPDSLLVISPHVYRSQSVDVLRDLAPVAPLAHHPLVLLVSSQLGVDSLEKFIALARATRPSLAYGSSAAGGQHHLLMERFKLHAGIDLLHVPYKGGAAAAHALATGQVSVIFGGAGAAPLVRSGKLRALAISGPTRSALFADVPALEEFYPGFRGSAWLGLFAPASIAGAIVEGLRGEVARVLSEPSTRARLADAGGLLPLSLPAAEFASLIRQDHQRYGEIVRQIGLNVE